MQQNYKPLYKGVLKELMKGQEKCLHCKKYSNEGWFNYYCQDPFFCNECYLNSGFSTCCFSYVPENIGILEFLANKIKLRSKIYFDSIDTQTRMNYDFQFCTSPEIRPIPYAFFYFDDNKKVIPRNIIYPEVK